MVSFPNIKINLGLNIVEKRGDGFHNIESIFYPVPFSDVLEILEAKETSFTSTGIAIPGDPTQNLCLKAYELLKKAFQLPDVHIHLHKVVPIGAGLGGGSSDAAFTLKMLNEKFDLKLSNPQLETYARKLGSDCAFFIDNTPKYCFNKGDDFEYFRIDMLKFYFKIVYPNIHISTPLAYAGVQPKKPISNVREIVSQPIETWKGTLYNDFEDSVFPKYPIIKSIKEQLYDQGALYASMSGSGSSVFGIFSKPVELLGMDDQYLIWHS